MNILVLNCGSSSLKYRLISMPAETELAGGEAQRVGPPTAKPSRIIHRVSGQSPQTHVIPMRNHAVAFEKVMKLLARTEEHAPDAVGHRIVHDGGLFRAHVVLDDASIAKLETRPRHGSASQPPRRQSGQGLPETVSRAAAGRGVRHGVSCDDPGLCLHLRHPGLDDSRAWNPQIRIPWHQPSIRGHGGGPAPAAAAGALNAVSCHLGSGGASLCAIVNGKSVDNTMGYSPLQGLIMSTRCGDLDPAVALRLMALSDGDYQSVEKLLNEKSGVLGLSGKSADIRDALSAPAHQDGHASRAELTAQIYLWRLRKYLGAYLAVVGRPAAIIFTDTVGETVPAVRWAMCANMEDFGVILDTNQNVLKNKLPADIAAPASAVRILVIATNEELSIARSAHSLLVNESVATRKGAAV